MGTKLLQRLCSFGGRCNLSSVTEHYGERKNLLNIIVEAFEKEGVIDNLTVDHLAPIDEFHIGGREATKDFINQLEISQNHNVLDIGCGLGGPSRFVASKFGCKVTGVDLTPEFISCGKKLTEMVNLTEKVKLLTGSALDLNSVLDQNESFDRAFMLHVGMNIENKSLLLSEIASKLNLGGLLGIYDVMKFGKNSHEDLEFPVPWTNNHKNNYATHPEEYKKAIEKAGMRIICERNRYDFAVEFFSKMKSKKDAPSIGLHLIMNEFPLKTANMLKNLKKERIAPIEMIAVKV